MFVPLTFSGYSSRPVIRGKFTTAVYINVSVYGQFVKNG